MINLHSSEEILVRELFYDFLLKNNLCNEGIDKNEINLIKLVGDASVRRYYRLRYINLNTNHSYILCLDQPQSQSLIDFCLMTKFMKKHELAVPDVYDYDLDRGYAIQQDLGDETLLVNLLKAQNFDEVCAKYKKCIDMLYLLQGTKRDDFVKEMNTQRSFDLKKLNEEVQFTNKYFLGSLLSCTDSEMKLVNEHMELINKKLASLNSVVAHRDFHSRNIMVSGENFYFIDYQDARLGNQYYDLVSLLEDSYFTLENNIKEELILYYYHKFEENISIDEFRYNYNLMRIQRTYKAIGSFCYIYFSRNDMRYIKYIGSAMQILKDSLLSSTEFAPLYSILFKLYYRD